MKYNLKPAATRKIMLATLLIISIAGLSQVPKPADVFGFEPGTDYKLAGYSQMVDYYTRLDKASDRVSMIEIGKSVLGRPMLLLFISTPENLKQLERWRNISEQLARAKIDEAKARQLVEEGKAIVWIDGGMHASEKAHGQMTSLLAHRIATEESAEMKKIRENVITLLMPVMNPDGMDIVVNWYKAMLGTPYEVTNPPWLWHHYIGHDNNRDWFMNNMPESKAVSEILYNKWYPQIVYNHHQSSPAWTRIFLPPFANPVNPNIHPGITTGVNLVGSAMANRFAMNKMPGVVSQIGFDMWWNGGMRTTPYYHNQIGILTETAHTSPTPSFYPPDSMPKTVGTGVTMPTDGKSIFYPNPWKGGVSRFGDAVKYMLTASMAVLNLAADRREEFMYNIYRMGRDAIESKDSLFAYVIPAEQWDKTEVPNLINVMRQGGVEVRRAGQAFKAGNGNYSAGSFIIYTAQAFRPYITDLFEKQVYPNQRLYPGGPPIRPYDLAGWTLPMQMGIKVDKIRTSFNVTSEDIKDRAAVTTGTVAAKAGYGYLLSHKENAAIMAVNQLLKNGVSVSMADSGFSAGKQKHEAGAFIIENGSNTDTEIKNLALKFGVTFESLDAKPSAGLIKLNAVRVGLYKSWVDNMDEGWTRWLLEQYGFTVDTLHDKDLLSKDLKTYQAIILPDQDKKAMLHGHLAGNMPGQYTGGMGLEGTVALKNYVMQGGNVIAFDEASDFAIEQFGLPVRNVVDGLSSSQFYIPGSLIKTIVNTKNPMAYGMQAEVAASFNNSRAFEIVRKPKGLEGSRQTTRESPDAPVEIIASYAKKDLLMSGWALNEEEYIGGKAAVVNVKMGSGNVVLFGFRPQFRGQPRGTYKLIFNAIYGMGTKNDKSPDSAE